MADPSIDEHVAYFACLKDRLTETSEDMEARTLEADAHPFEDGIGSRQVPEFGSFLGRLAKGMPSNKDDTDPERVPTFVSEASLTGLLRPA
jgi:hypothetical protein